MVLFIKEYFRISVLCLLLLSEFFLQTKYCDKKGQLKQYIRKKITSKTVKRLWYIPQHFFSIWKISLKITLRLDTGRWICKEFYQLWRITECVLSLESTSETGNMIKFWSRENKSSVPLNSWWRFSLTFHFDTQAVIYTLVDCTFVGSYMFELWVGGHFFVTPVMLKFTALEF
jgi:hypothetical protein